MDRTAYSSMSAQEADHWWFVARRTIISTLIDKHVQFGADPEILEAGCGTGGNLAMLSAYGRLDAFEYDADAQALAVARGCGEIGHGALPDDIGFGDKVYDLVALLDVLEHIDDDVGSLAALGERLKPGGSLLLTVPAVPWLWSNHDVLHHHKRRYTRESLENVVAQSGLKNKAAGYFNSLLFPLALAQRVGHQISGSNAPLDARPSMPINAVLRTVFAMERHLLDRIQLPIGLSLYAVITR